MKGNRLRNVINNGLLVMTKLMQNNIYAKIKK